jgi:hypothetical protein
MCIVEKEVAPVIRGKPNRSDKIENIEASKWLF